MHQKIIGQTPESIEQSSSIANSINMWLIFVIGPFAEGQLEKDQAMPRHLTSRLDLRLRAKFLELGLRLETKDLVTTLLNF